MCDSCFAMSEEKDNKPDVEAIIAEITRDIESIEPPDELASETGNLYDELRMAGRTFSGGYLPTGGLTAVMRKIIYRMLGLKEFHGRLIRILCRIMGMLEGKEVPESSVVLTGQRNIMDLLIQLSERLADYDRMRIEERLSALEAEVDKLKSAGCAVTREHVVNAGGGLYFGNYGEFEKCVDYLLESGDIARKMGECGRQYVLDNFTWEKIVNRYRTEVFDIGSKSRH